jgi:hypothetical protein
MIFHPWLSSNEITGNMILMRRVRRSSRPDSGRSTNRPDRQIAEREEEANSKPAKSVNRKQKSSNWSSMVQEEQMFRKLELITNP